VIDATAHDGIAAHIATARREGRVLKEIAVPETGTFIGPTLIELPGIAALKQEIFGPVLHVVTFEASELDAVIDAINATGYGLTFGLQTRIDDRVQHVTDRIHAGNIYVNRNQIGAVVGSQPFGGEGLSGTGPKAGGPHYMPRFCAPNRQQATQAWNGQTSAPPSQTTGTAAAPKTHTLPGPTGESNRLTLAPRAPLLCLGPGRDTVAAQSQSVSSLGGTTLNATGMIDIAALETLDGFSAVLWWGDADTGRAIEQALSRRNGPILPLIPGNPTIAQVMSESHVCVDTTASGGNADLLGGAS